MTRSTVPTSVTVTPLSTLVGGSLPGIVGDGSDASYAWVQDWGEVTAQFAAVSIPSNEYVDCLRLRTRTRAPFVGTPPTPGHWWWTLAGADTDADGGVTFPAATTSLVQRGAVPHPRPTVAQMAAGAFGIRLKFNSTAARFLYLYELTADVVTSVKPAATVAVTDTDRTRPTVSVGMQSTFTATVTTKALTSNVATLTTSAAHGVLVGNRITVAGVGAPFDGEWAVTAVTSTTIKFAVTAANVTSTAAAGTVTLGEFRSMYGFDVRVFPAAVAAAAGFDPATTTPTWATTEDRLPAGDLVERGLSVDLASGDWVAYARVRPMSLGDSGVNDWSTDWTWAAFTVAVSYAAPAAITAAWNPTTQATDITVTTRGNLLGPELDTEVDASGWLPTRATVARVADAQAPHGSYVAEFTISSTLTPPEAEPYALAFPGVVGGERYLLRVPVRVMSGTLTLAARMTFSGGAVPGAAVDGSPVVVTAAQGWTTLVVNGVANAEADHVGFSVKVTAGAAIGVQWRVDAPTVCLAVDAADTGAGLVWGQGGAGAGLSGMRVLVERSSDGGTTWSQVRAPAGADQTALGVAGERLAVTDHEAPRGGTLRYRAALVATSPGVMVSPGTTVTVTATSDDQWWLTPILDPDLAVAGARVERDPTFSIDEQLGVFRAIGRGRPIVVSGGIGGEDGAATIHTSSAAEHAAVLAVLRHQGVVLVRSPFVDEDGVRLQWWARFTARSWALSGVPTQPRRPIAVSWLDVGNPAIGG